MRFQVIAEASRLVGLTAIRRTPALRGLVSYEKRWQWSGEEERQQKFKFFDPQHLLGASAAWTLAGAGGSVLCASAEEVKAEQEQANALVDSMAPLLGQLSVGSVAGYAAGYALRVVGNMAAFTIGSAFIALQSACYAGYIEVNWQKSTSDMRTLLDMDGDGDFDHDDIKMVLNKFIEICTYNLPSGAGFTAGLTLGLGFGGKTAAVVGTASLVPRVVAFGGTAMAGPGMLVTLKEYSDLAMSEGHKAVKQVLSVNPEEAFKKSISELDLGRLREVEKELKTEKKTATSPEAQALLAAKMKILAEAKELQKKNTPRGWLW